MKTLRITILLSVFGASTASLFAAPIGGAPRPQVSMLSEVVAAVEALLGM